MIVAGLLRTRRMNFGRDPSTTGVRRPPNSRDALSEKKVDTLCVPNSTRRSGVKQWVVFKEIHVVFRDVRRVVFSDVRVVFGEFSDTYSAYPLSDAKPQW